MTVAGIGRVATRSAGDAIGGVLQVRVESSRANLGHPGRSVSRTPLEASRILVDHLIRGRSPRTPGLWTLPDLPRPVDAAREQEAARSRRPPAAWESPMKLEIPTGPWKALRAFHSAHRPDYERVFVAQDQEHERLVRGEVQLGRRYHVRPMDVVEDDEAVFPAAHRPAVTQCDHSAARRAAEPPLTTCPPNRGRRIPVGLRARVPAQ